MQNPSRRWALLAVALGVAAGVAMPSVGLYASGTAWPHQSCQDGGIVFSQSDVWVPAQIINSPFGGWARGSVDVQGGPSVGSGWVYNGAVVWNGAEVNLTVHSYVNVTSRGAGTPSPCHARFGVALSPLGDVAIGMPLVGPGNVSDSGEPNTLMTGNSSSITFGNGFSVANQGTLSTCGGSGNASILASSAALWLTLTFRTDGQEHSVPFLAPGANASFQYWFPANFGTWAVEDLSSGGGPGGGLAFDFLGTCR